MPNIDDVCRSTHARVVKSMVCKWMTFPGKPNMTPGTERLRRWPPTFLGLLCRQCSLSTVGTARASPECEGCQSVVLTPSSVRCQGGKQRLYGDSRPLRRRLGVCGLLPYVWELDEALSGTGFPSETSGFQMAARQVSAGLFHVAASLQRVRTAVAFAVHFRMDCVNSGPQACG